MFMWPNESDYTKALISTNPFPFALLKKQNLKIVENENGKPIKSVGKNTVVFKVAMGEKYYALKCYTSEIYNQVNYLSSVDEYIKKADPTWITPFELFKEEELVILNEATSFHGVYPFLLMPWVEGVTLYEYVKSCCAQHDTNALTQLYEQFKQMADWLLQQPFAHGDLSASSIMVTPEGKLKIIDHDKIQFKELAITKGHVPAQRVCQHPRRNYNVVDLATDQFSILALAISLKSLLCDPTLFDRYAHPIGLLFKAQTLKESTESPLYNELSKIEDQQLQQLLRLYQLALSRHNIEVPMLQPCLAGQYIIPENWEHEIEVAELKTALENAQAEIHFLKTEVWAEKVSKEKQITENKRLNETILKLQQRKLSLRKRNITFGSSMAVLAFFGIMYFLLKGANSNIHNEHAALQTKSTTPIAKKAEQKNNETPKLNLASTNTGKLSSGVSTTITKAVLIENASPKKTSISANVPPFESSVAIAKPNKPIKKKPFEKETSDVSFRTGNF
jgi:hypothetical protein